MGVPDRRQLPPLPGLPVPQNTHPAEWQQYQAHMQSVAMSATQAIPLMPTAQTRMPAVPAFPSTPQQPVSHGEGERERTPHRPQSLYHSTQEQA
eukprot:3911901-Amphidinium_carterae.2